LSIPCDYALASTVKADLNRFRRRKARFSPNQFRSGSLESIEMKLNAILHHLSLALQDALHVRRHWSCLDAIFRTVPREPVRLRAANHVLAGSAGDIRTRPADVFSLDYSRAVTGLGLIPRPLLARLTPSDNQDFL